MDTSQEKDQWKKAVALLCLGWLVIWVYRTMLTPVFDEIQMTVGSQTGARMGLIASCYFFGYVCMQIPGGVLMDKIGKRAVLVPGFLLFGAGTVVVGMARSMWAIYVGSVMAGLGTGTYYSGAYTLSGESVPKARKYIATAFINNGCAFGMIIGLLCSSLLVKQAGMPWQGMAFGTAALAFLMVPVLLRVLKKDRPAHRAQAAEAVEQKPALFSLGQVSTYVFYFSTCYGYYMVVTWLPSFLQQERGITGAAIGLAASIVAVASIPGALLFGALLDRFRQHKILALTLLQLGAAMMLVLSAVFRSLPPLLCCLALYGLAGKQAVDPLIIPHVSELSGGAALSTALGVFNFFGMSSSVLAPTVTGLIYDATGTRVYAFYLAAGLLLASAILFFAANRAGAPGRQNQPESEG